jgi:hypothetical protein
LTKNVKSELTTTHAQYQRGEAIPAGIGPRKISDKTNSAVLDVIKAIFFSMRWRKEKGVL